MLVIGIDPGISGSICFFKDGKILGRGTFGTVKKCFSKIDK